MDEALELSPHNVITGAAVIFVVGVLHLGTPFIVFVLSVVRAISSSRRARVADAQGGASVPLEPGAACIRGSIEEAPGHDLLLRVEIDQHGANHKGKGDKWSHSWTETSRLVTAAPFYVKDDRGRVRVEPDERTLLVDKLDRTVRKGEDERTRIAEITHDEVVYVVGMLERSRVPGAGAYRDAEGALVMRPPPDGRLLVSTERLGDRFRQAMRMQRGFAIFFAIFMTVFIAADLPFYLRLLGGRVVNAAVVGKTFHPGKSPYCELEVELPSKKRVSVDTDAYRCQSFGQLDSSPTYVKVYVVGEDSFVHLGSRPGLHIATIGIAAVILVFGLLGYAMRAKPWYEGKVVDRGPGKLMESSD
jgi:hypothetical protein